MRSALSSAQHFVCTPVEARQIVARHAEVWLEADVTDEGAINPEPQRREVCLIFHGETAAQTPGVHQVRQSELEAILEDATVNWMVALPFVDPVAGSETAGIRFCSVDASGQLPHAVHETFERGALMALTAPERCRLCGTCAPHCAFGARWAEPGAICLDLQACHGCGLCAEACPRGAITMVPRY